MEPIYTVSQNIEQINLLCDLLTTCFSDSKIELSGINVIMDENTINYWEKLVTTLNKCILAEEVYTKIDVPKLAQFAQILAQKAKQLQSWTFEHKCGAIKIELDDQEADESKTTDLKKKINEFSKKNFSFIPMVSVLRRLLKKINKDTEKKQMEILEEKLANTESEANFQSQEMAKEDSSQNLRKKPESKGVSVMLCDCNGTIHAFNKVTPKMFHVSGELLKGKNFFKLMSAYSRRFCYETYGNSIFKTFKQSSKSLRYSLPHMDDVDSENFFVLTSKFTLVNPKKGSKMKSNQFMIRVCSRPSSKESTEKMYRSYTQARKEIREEDAMNAHFLDGSPAFNAPSMQLHSGILPQNHF